MVRSRLVQEDLLHFITMTSQWAGWRLKSPASRVFTQPFIRAQIKENTKAPRHWSLCGEFRAQMASNAEAVSIWWRHLVLLDESSQPIMKKCRHGVTTETAIVRYGVLWTKSDNPHMISKLQSQSRRSKTSNMFPCGLYQWLSARLQYLQCVSNEINSSSINLVGLRAMVYWQNPYGKGRNCSVSWWRHQMETFSALLALCEGNPPMVSPHKGQWRGALMCFFYLRLNKR